MPALVESSSENRRPRRSSITQQLQRMFHKDKPDDVSCMHFLRYPSQKSVRVRGENDNWCANSANRWKARKSNSYDDPFSTDIVASTAYKPNCSVRPMGASSPVEYANHGPYDVNSTGYNRDSYSSSNSKATGLKASESRPSSAQSFRLESQQLVKDSPTVDGALKTQDIDRSPTVSHSVVEKKERRATKRLEAERLELEKRMLKLEEAERTRDISVLRRESRRLTKKQPFGSSSRSSSVSGDESRSRPPSRISSIFSSSRRRSRSRSSSIDGVDNTRFTGRVEAPSNENVDALPALSSTLPERLSTAISKELAARKTALLASPEQSSHSLKLPQMKPGTESTNGSPSQQTIRDGEDMTPYAFGAIPRNNIHQEEQLESRSPEIKVDHHQPTDLDKALFTASLTSKKRSVALSQSGEFPKTGQTTHTNMENESSDSHHLPEDDEHNANLKHGSKTVPWGGSPRSLLARASTDGVIQQHHKKFKSSPLAESQTINGDGVLSAPKRATTLVSLQISDKAQQQRFSNAENVTSSRLSMASSPNVLQTSSFPDKRTIHAPPSITVKSSVTETMDVRPFMSRIPTSKPSQLAPSALLTKPRFYNSLNKVTGPSGGKHKAFGTLPPPRQERDSSPTVPPKSPKRGSRTLSQSPDLAPEDRTRPKSSQSVGMSQDSESDYNTADETASVRSRTSDGGDLPIPKKIRAAGKTRAASKKDMLSEPDSGPVPAVSSSSKADMRRMSKKARQIGRDQLVAKLFVICCRCKFWHDMPSEVYASLTLSDPLSAALDQELAAWDPNALSDRLTVPTTGVRPPRESSAKSPRSETQQSSVRTRITADLPSGPVKCCWCEHHMSKQCCQGWTTVVQMRQRHH